VPAALCCAAAITYFTLPSVWRLTQRWVHISRLISGVERTKDTRNALIGPEAITGPRRPTA